MNFSVSAVPEFEVCRGLEAKPTVQYIPSFQMHNTKCSSTESLRITAQIGQNLSFTMIPLTDLDEEVSMGVIVNEKNHQHIPLLVGAQSSQLPPIKADAVSVILDGAVGMQPFVLAYQGKHACLT